jgi:hypothetical protein
VVGTSPNKKQVVGFAAKGYTAVMRNDAGTWTAIRATIADAKTCVYIPVSLYSRHTFITAHNTEKTVIP